VGRLKGTAAAANMRSIATTNADGTVIDDARSMKIVAISGNEGG